jgi:hypothetical protein
MRLGGNILPGSKYASPRSREVTGVYNDYVFKKC